MSKPFDASPKWLMELRPADWPAFLGVKARSVEIVDADISTVTAATDKVLLIRSDEGDRIQHFDFQSGPNANVPQRSHWYNSLLEDRHGLPVESVVVLLCREAKLKVINGVYERRLPGKSKPYLRFEYQVLRMWELAVETVLSAGPSVVPLAPLAAVKKTQLPGIIHRMKERLDAEPDRSIVANLWTATEVLMGLRYKPAFVERLLQGVRVMEESTTYQAILEKGGLKEGRRMLLRMGEKRFLSPAPPEVSTALEAIANAEELDRLGERLLEVGDWAALLAPLPGSPTPRRSRRKKSS